MKKFSFFIDDNIFFLKELTVSPATSVFEHFYLAGLRELHRKYGVKFLLNLFKGDQNSGFMLDEFPDRFKREFAANADWLRFSYHAAFDVTHYFDCPGFIPAGEAEYIRDYRYVQREVARFAGSECFMFPQIIHYVEAVPGIKRFLYGEGVRLLADRRKFFAARSAAAGHTVISYPDPEVPEITRIPFELVLNNVPLAEVEPELLVRIDNESRNYISIMTHEPQFYTYCPYYIPEHWDRLEKAFALLTARGYTPVWGPDITAADL